MSDRGVGDFVRLARADRDEAARLLAAALGDDAQALASALWKAQGWHEERRQELVQPTWRQPTWRQPTWRRGPDRRTLTIVLLGATDASDPLADRPPSPVEAFRAGARWALTELLWGSGVAEQAPPVAARCDELLRDVVPHLGPARVGIAGEAFTFDRRSSGYFRAYPEDSDRG